VKLVKDSLQGAEHIHAHWLSVRLHVNLNESDELGTFIFRTTGFNSIRTLAARLAYYHAASNDLLSCLPLQLILRGKSTTQSYRTPVYYVDLTMRDGINLNDAIVQAKQINEQSKAAVLSMWQSRDWPMHDLR